MNYKDLNVVVALTQMDIEPWKSILDHGQKSTWMKSCPDDFQIVNVFGLKPNKALNNLDKFHEYLRLAPWGNGVTNRLDGLLNKILNNKSIPEWNIRFENKLGRMDVKALSTYVTAVVREFSLFQYFLECTDANYLYMSNSSSYVNLNNLKHFIETLPENSIYGGTVMTFADFKFCSGANRIFSRDVVELLLRNFSNLDYRYLNDVSIGHLLSKYELANCEVPSLTFSSTEEIAQANFNKLKTGIHFRLKSGTLKYRNDISLMKFLDSKIYS